MRAHVMDGNVIANTIEVESLDFMPNLIDADLYGGGPGDSIIDDILVPKPGLSADDERIASLKSSIEQIEAEHPITPRQMRELALIVRQVIQAVAPTHPPVHGLEVANDIDAQIVALRVQI